MLTELHLKNFRSVLEADIKFAASGLSVVVGANGSGKSNLIKAIDFISRVANRGLEAAIVSIGGIEAIIPKAIPREDTAKTMTSFGCSVSLPRPSFYPDDAPPLLVDYQLGLGAIENNLDLLDIKYERLLFHEPLLLSRFQNNTHITNLSKRQYKFSDRSHISINRNENGELSIEEKPEII